MFLLKSDSAQLLRKCSFHSSPFVSKTGEVTCGPLSINYSSYGGLLIYCFVLPRYIIRNGGIDTEAGYPYPCNKSCCFDKDKVGATLTGKRQRSRIPRSVLALRSN